jgi:hypothetical protein
MDLSSVGIRPARGKGRDAAPGGFSDEPRRQAQSAITEARKA